MFSFSSETSQPALDDDNEDEDVRGSPVDNTQLRSFSARVSLVPSLVNSISYEDVHLREHWTGQYDFLISCIGFAVGLGNIWRFPFLCYENGGGAFLIPYTFFMTACSIPLFFLEISCGQFSSLSILTVWRISPLFRGIGHGMIIITLLVCIYYNVIIAWVFYFLFSSMRPELPWTLCGQSWNTPSCMVGWSVRNMSQRHSSSHGELSGAEFWERNVLEMTDGIENFGTIRWPLFGCLFLAWVVVFLCLCKGIQSSGKVVYVTAMFPYVVLIILLVRGVTLPGSVEGIKFYLIPKWAKLTDPTVWGYAAVQIFYSVGMAWGSLITLASYNKFDHNVYREAIAVPIVNCATSVLAGCVVFSTLGFMAYKSGLPIEEVVAQGPGLTFVAYPEAVSRMPFPRYWSVMFFLMIFSVGVDTQFGFFETITCAFIDEYPEYLRQHKTLFTAFACLVAFLLGVPLVFQGGIYLLQIIDWYAATFSLMLISVVECIVVCWIYGDQRFVKDIELMTGKSPGTIWQIMWKYVTPLLVLFTWLFNVGTLEPVTIKAYHFPRWATYLGWAMGGASLVPVPVMAIVGIRRERTGTVWQRIKKLAQPAYNWGPALDKDKVKYFMSMNQYERERFEAAYFNVDRHRYLAMREVDSQNKTVCVNVETTYDKSTILKASILPVEAAVFFPILSCTQAVLLPKAESNLSINEDLNQENMEFPHGVHEMFSQN